MIILRLLAVVCACAAYAGDVKATMFFANAGDCVRESGSPHLRLKIEGDDELVPTPNVHVRDVSGVTVPHSLIDNGFELVQLSKRVQDMASRVAQAELGTARGATAHSTTEQQLQWAYGSSGGSSNGESEQDLVSLLAHELASYKAFVRPMQRMYLKYTFRCAGSILRKVQPGGAVLPGNGAAGGGGLGKGGRWMGASRSVHIDQDLDGAPLRTMFGGTLHALMRAIPALRLLNVWLPLVDPPVRPLAIMETSRSPARPAVQDKLHFRDWKNDRFYFLHNDNSTQRWWYAPQMRFGSAFVFDATSTPHTSFSLPAEHCLSERVINLRAMRRALLKRGSARDTELQVFCTAGSKRCAALEDGAPNEASTSAAASSIGSRLYAMLSEADDLLLQACNCARNSDAAGSNCVAALDRKISRYLASTVRHSIEFRCLVLKISNLSDVGFIVGGLMVMLAAICMAVHLLSRCFACIRPKGATHECRKNKKKME